MTKFFLKLSSKKLMIFEMHISQYIYIYICFIFNCSLIQLNAINPYQYVLTYVQQNIHTWETPDAMLLN